MEKYPYIPEGKMFLFVPSTNEYMRMAQETALRDSLDNAVKTGAVLVKDGEVIGSGANGSDYHLKFECERVKQGIPTGQGYELCEGCHPKNHAEARATRDAAANGTSTGGADLYLWGHWWACESCWNAIQESGIGNVYLLEGSDRLFNKSDPENILGRWSEVV